VEAILRRRLIYSFSKESVYVSEVIKWKDVEAVAEDVIKSFRK
jgi:hypothetical protein